MNTPFRTTISKLFNNDISNNDIYIENIRIFVVKNKGQDIEITDCTLSFKVSIFGWTWDFFSFINNGKFIITPKEIIFHFSMSRIVVFFMAVSIIAFFNTKDFYVFFPFIGVIFLSWAAAFFKYKKMLEKFSIGNFS